MPLFIGISGFLINIEMINLNFFSLFKKYWRRLGLPWVIAVAVFLLTNNIITKFSDFSIKSIIHAYFYPYYHLWYIMSFISYLLILCFLWFIFRSTKYKWFCIFVVVSIISFISKWDLLCCQTKELLKVIYSLYKTLHSQHDYN